MVVIDTAASWAAANGRCSHDFQVELGEDSDLPGASVPVGAAASAICCSRSSACGLISPTSVDAWILGAGQRARRCRYACERATEEAALRVVAACQGECLAAVAVAARGSTQSPCGCSLCVVIALLNPPAGNFNGSLAATAPNTGAAAPLSRSSARSVEPEHSGFLGNRLPPWLRPRRCLVIAHAVGSGLSLAH